MTMKVDPIDPTELEAGMPVIAADDKQIGVVKKVGSNDFLIDRSLARDIYLSFGFIRAVGEGRILLTISSDEVVERGSETSI